MNENRREVPDYSYVPDEVLVDLAHAVKGRPKDDPTVAAVEKEIAKKESRRGESAHQ